jgi:hypothetical protein
MAIPQTKQYIAYPQQSTPNENSQNILKKWHVFGPENPTTQATTTHHEITTTPPQKTIPKTPVFPKPPPHMPVKRQKKPRPKPGLFPIQKSKKTKR